MSGKNIERDQSIICMYRSAKEKGEEKVKKEKKKKKERTPGGVY